MKTKPKSPAPPEFPCVVESFRRPGQYERDNFGNDSGPTCWNGVVSIRRYRITFEEIEEPNEILAERLRKLWRESENHHHYQPMKYHADQLGIVLDPAECGKDRKNP